MCIYVEGKYCTPREFETSGGKGRAKNWKKSIKSRKSYLKANLTGTQGSMEELVTPTPPVKLTEPGE